MKTLRHYILPLTASLLLLGALSCTKTEEKAALTGTQSIIHRIPATSVAFLTWNSESAGYQRYKKSPWGSMGSSFFGDLETKLTSQGGPDSEKALRIFKSIKEAGLTKTNPDGTGIFVDGVLFADGTAPENNIAAGLYLSGKEGTDVAPQLQAIRDILQKEQIAVQDFSAGDAKGFFVPAASIPDFSAPVKGFYAVSKGNRLAVTSTEPLARALFTDGTPSGYDSIKQTAAYKAGTKEIDTAGDALSFGYVDFERIVALVKTLPGGGADTQQLDLVPLESASLVRHIDDSMNLGDMISVSVKPKDDGQRKWAATLGRSGSNDMTSRSPKDTSILISLGSSMLTTLKEGVLDSLTPEEKTQAQPFITLADSISALAIGVRKSTGDSPFPDLLVLAQTTDAAKTGSAIKQLVDSSIGNAGTGGWQEQEIGGKKVAAMFSPLGVGMFVTSAKDTVIITSSKTAMGECIQAIEGGGKGLSESLSKPARALITDASPLVSAYTNFGQIADLVESVQGSLAMFTGGQTSFAKEDLESLRKMGSLATAINFHDGNLKIQTTFEPPKKG